MNRKSVITAMLAAGLVTVASAQTHTVYITGSTAYRSVVFNACTHGNGFAGTGPFDAAATFLPAGANGSSSDIIYIGNIGGVPYKVVCGWSGSEAGIANVAGRTSLGNVTVPANWGGNLAQSGSGLQNLPGVPYTFLDPNGNGTTREGSARTADLAFADTSRVVSLTPNTASTHEYGVVGIVPFVWTKGFTSAASSSWNHMTNVTIPQLSYAIATTEPAAFFSGDVNDGDNVYIVGRNKGSGTRVNTLLNIQFFPSQPVQYTAYSLYSGTSPNLTLALSGSWAAHAKVSAATGSDLFTNTPSGDGFDSGGNVAKILQLDCTGATAFRGNPGFFLGYLGVADSISAEGQGAVRLPLDGVFYNQQNVTLGTYTLWGYEHMYGQASPSADANTTQSHFATGVDNYLVFLFSGGDSTAPGVALSEMIAARPGQVDTGYPTP
jgi:hypothetical protein